MTHSSRPTQTTTSERPPRPALIERLQSIQDNLGLNDSQLARKLGIERSYWSQMKNGHRELGRRALRRILRQWPELREDVLAYIEADDIETVSVA